MKRTTLGADSAQWLADTIARRKAEFGGWAMEVDPTSPPAPEPAPPLKQDDSIVPPDDFKSDHSKQSVLADLAKERDARKAIEAEMSTLKSSLAEAFGVKPDPEDDGDVLVTVQKQLADLRHESAVLRVASEHAITDKDDLALLSGITDPEAMQKMGARMAPDPEKPRPPRPDPNQGRFSTGQVDVPAGVPRMAQAFDDAMNTK